MLNIEELTLFLCVIITQKRTYIDGDQLDEEVLKYMPRLKKFIFSIYTQVSLGFKREIDLQSTDDIRNSFIKRGIQSIDACSDSTFVYSRANCHVYSLPYQFNDLLYMNNSFQGGRFDKVRFILMEDIRPFEHKLFQIISQSFPFLQKLIVFNQQPQRNKQDESLTLIIFNHLFELNLGYVNSDYVKQFLSDKSTRLPCLTNLKIDYQKLVTITNNFTNDTARLNCAKIKYLETYPQVTETENFSSYFPSLYK
jgi:hypothetical protein